MFFIITHCKYIKFVDCGDGEIKTVEITPCAAEPCAMKRGSAVKMIITYISNQTDSSPVLKPYAKVGVFGINVTPIDYCEVSDCPVFKMTENKVPIRVTIPNWLPASKLTLKAELLSAAGSKFFCGTYEGRII
ncbi:group 2 allergen Sui m 2-like protein [Leptotrombidium deliense]|uniref:Group 2 allergen Sui m 2-like protein n=1 Tax=Leptotrombidium deliense TaxID=299467 RepID=A0A443SDH5_9ACAR|nr:group 2 allergen Sui m 2-like protein [Leptotrombidium deliense]